MSFAEFEGLIGATLPVSSRNVRTLRAWWDKDRSPNSRHCQSKRGWLAAGWEVESVDLDGQTVTFRR